LFKYVDHWHTNSVIFLYKSLRGSNLWVSAISQKYLKFFISDFCNQLFHYLNATPEFVFNYFILSCSNKNVRIWGLKGEALSFVHPIFIIEQVFERVLVWFLVIYSEYFYSFSIWLDNILIRSHYSLDWVYCIITYMKHLLLCLLIPHYQLTNNP
jgi:hypothetical protein